MWVLVRIETKTNIAEDIKKLENGEIRTLEQSSRIFPKPRNNQYGEVPIEFKNLIKKEKQKEQNSAANKELST